MLYIDIMYVSYLTSDKNCRCALTSPLTVIHEIRKICPKLAKCPSSICFRSCRNRGGSLVAKIESKVVDVIIARGVLNE